MLSAFAPWAVTLALILGGVYLAFEGAEKIYDFFVPHKHSETEVEVANFTEEDFLKIEKKKVKSAIFTDFILSVEIVIIALGTVLGKPILFQIFVVSIVAIIATVGVYGIVALIVRMDDFGYKLVKLSSKEKSISKFIGNTLINALPVVIKSLSVIGTIALILVSGGIFVHNIEFLHHFLEVLPSMLRDFIIGLLVGFIALVVVKFFKFVFNKK